MSYADNEDSLPSIIEKQLFEDRVIVFTGDVDDKSIRELIMKLRILERDAPGEEIQIYLTSEGGGCYETLGLYEVCRAISSPVNIHVDGYAFSAALFILATCATGVRTCGRHTSFMYHPGWSCNEGRLDDMAEYTKEFKRSEQIMTRMLAKHTNLSVKEIKTIFNKDFWFGPKQAKEWGIIDEYC